ncbi:unnamed protein product [Spirodela intermedia]|uniref:Uncharacterized protein n=1 Tax=Spirodela intermedia TaxID=51605 RepID=A0ABN7EBL5_SPIIN|nr:unnamed protein product [Spirodela intermedia]
MAKKRNNKKKGDASAMDISTEAQTSISQPKAVAPSLRAASRKISKGIPMRRAKNLRNRKRTKLAKNKDKLSRIQSAKSLLRLVQIPLWMK